MTPELLTTITTITVAVLGLAVAILRIIKDSGIKAESQTKLETAERVVTSIADAVNLITPVLGVDQSKALKGEIKANASANGVIGELDGLLKRHGLNDRSTAELANPHP